LLPAVCSFPYVRPISQRKSLTPMIPSAQPARRGPIMPHIGRVALCLAGWLLCLPLLQGQVFLTEKNAPPKAVEQYVEARQLLFNKEVKEGMQRLEKLLKKYPNFVDARLLYAESFAFEQQYDRARAEYLLALELAPDHRPVAYFTLGRIAKEQGRYDECAQRLEKFLTYPTASEELRRRAEKMLADARFIPGALAAPLPFAPQNLGPNINTADPEYAAMLTADAQKMVFTRLLPDGRAKQEDFFVSERLPDGTWGPAKPLGEPVNTPYNEGAQSLSANGRLLVYTTGQYPDGMGNTDLYISELLDGRWTRPVNMGEPINGRAAETQPALSANGDLLIFASNRAGTKGDLDLWISKRQPDGSWSAPENLSELNTPYEDGSPFLHADGKTLYFRSRGLPGFGDFDLYRTQLQPDGHWSTPMNLGHPINTPSEEGLLVITLDGREGYFFSGQGPGHQGSWDIYRFEVPQQIRPFPATYARIKVLDAETRRPLRAAAELFEFPSERLFSSGKTDRDGEWLVCLPSGTAYGLNLQASGYLLYSDHFDLADGYSAEKPFEIEVLLQRIPSPAAEIPVNTPPKKTIGKPVILRNVFFQSGSAALKPESKGELDRLKKMMDDHPTVRLQIQGHTDNVGAEQDNLSLSEARATAVIQYLISKGIAPARLTAKGFGETQPIDTNDTPKGRANNRRTEFIPVE
jgi:outer membrane protein OmpA-like peptidoglycan-associated protein/tetratricopeptide (TPR) repeat protein